MQQRASSKMLALLLAVVLAALGAACQKANEDSRPEDTISKVVLGVNADLGEVTSVTVNDKAFPDGVVITGKLLPGEAAPDSNTIIIEAGYQGTVTLKDLDVNASADGWPAVSVGGTIANPVLIEGNVSLTAPFGDAFSGSGSCSIELIGKASLIADSKSSGGIVLYGDEQVLLTINVGDGSLTAIGGGYSNDGIHLRGSICIAIENGSLTSTGGDGESFGGKGIVAKNTIEITCNGSLTAAGGNCSRERAPGSDGIFCFNGLTFNGSPRALDIRPGLDGTGRLNGSAIYCYNKLTNNTGLDIIKQTSTPILYP